MLLDRLGGTCNHRTTEVVSAATRAGECPLDMSNSAQQDRPPKQFPDVVGFPCDLTP